MVTINGNDYANEKAFEIKDFSFGVENPTTIGSATGGAGAAKVKFNEFTITKTVDATTPLLLTSCASGERLPTVVLHYSPPGPPTGEVMTFTLPDAICTGLHQTTAPNGIEREQVSFAYRQIQVTDPADQTTFTGRPD